VFVSPTLLANKSSLMNLFGLFCSYRKNPCFKTWLFADSASFQPQVVASWASCQILQHVFDLQHPAFKVQFQYEVEENEPIFNKVCLSLFYWVFMITNNIYYVYIYLNVLKTYRGILVAYWACKTMGKPIGL
jgi:hypothetical protein